MDHFCLDINHKSNIKSGYNTCQRLVRREDFSAHRMYHSQIQAFIPGHIVQRCPISNEGCDFVSSALLPRRGRLKLVLIFFFYLLQNL